MNQQVNNWGPAALIVFGYIAAAYWQSKRFDDMKEWFHAEIGRLETKVDAGFKNADLQFKTVNEKLG